MPKYLIINCDDFGSSHAANEAIMTLLDEGAVTSATAPREGRRRIRRVTRAPLRIADSSGHCKMTKRRQTTPQTLWASASRSAT